MWFGDFDLSEEEVKPQRRAFDYIRRLWPFFSPYRWRIVAAGALLLVSSGLGLLGPLLFKRAIDVNIAQGDIRGLVGTSVVFLLVQMAIFFATYYQMLWLAQVGEKGAANLKQRLFEHILTLPMAFFDRMPSGKLISRVESDTEALKMLFTRTSVMMVQSLLVVVGMSVVMVLTSWRLYLVSAALLPPFVLAFWVFQRKVRPLYRSVRRTVADINNLVLEALKGLPVIQVFNQENRFGRRMDELNREKFIQEFRAQRLWYVVWFLVDLGEVAGIALVLGVGGWWALKGGLTIGTLVLFVSYISRLFGPVRAISDQINMLERAFASAERALEILEQAPEPAGRMVDGFRLRQGIKIDGVTFAYDREPVLKDVNLTISRGEKVALVGETGGGKSSIVSLVLKFYQPQQGRVLFDDMNLADLDPKSVRRVIGFVPQEVVVFPGTVLDNLRLFDDSIPAEQVINAARRVRIDGAISRFTRGYDTVLSEGGGNFSLGERQLLAFARALVRDPEILILDEATSAVDPQTEGFIQEGLKELLKGRTAIIVAHRLATVQMADRIVVVHKGRIVETGRHEELLAKGGIYSRLYRLQFIADEG